MTVYARPGTSGSAMSFQSRYENFIGGQWVPPAGGGYFENPTPVTGEVFCEVARSTEADIEKALDAAHAVAPGWGKTAPGERAVLLNKIADRIEAAAFDWVTPEDHEALRESLRELLRGLRERGPLVKAPSTAKRPAAKAPFRPAVARRTPAPSVKAGA